MIKVPFLLVCFLVMVLLPLPAQTHRSVPLDAPVYQVLELAQLRGLLPPLPSARPYSRNTVLSAIDTILSAGGSSRLSAAERRILEEARNLYGGQPEPGPSLTRGAWHFGNEGEGEEGLRLTADMGLRLEEEVSGGFGLEEKDFSWGNDFWITAYMQGDLSNSLSWAFDISGAVLRVPRQFLGTYNTFYQGFVGGDPPWNENQVIDVYGQPLSHFPWTYRKRWDGYVWNVGQVDNSGMLGWPEGISIGYTMMPELAGSLLKDRLLYRFGRLGREWGAVTAGSGLVLSREAPPFFGMELTARPLDWLYFSSLTGVLEYSLDNEQSIGPFESQTAFSLGLVEFNYRNFFHLDFGSSVVWPKRFELGYPFPLIDNFLYQNNIGDFDNMALFLDLSGQYPGVGKLWVSFFLDEINPEKGIFTKDRAMFAFQGGGVFAVPFLPFASVRLSYTKIEPYCYTHTRVFVPWYGQDSAGDPIRVQEAYTNGGFGLGYYLPPNSDELKLRFDLMGGLASRAHLQYQMVRRGADHGSNAVDGSHYRSELSSRGRSDRPQLEKYFLHDGAYQWQHIIRLGGEYTLRSGRSFPLTLYGEAGVVFSYYTNIETGKANSGESLPWQIMDTPEYPRETSLVFSVGVRLFPE